MWLTFAGAVVTFLWLWPSLPDRVPIHWDAGGRVDGWGPPETWWLVALVMVIDYGIVWLVLAASAHTPSVDLEPDISAEIIMLVNESRRLTARMVEWMMLGINSGMAILWIGGCLAGLPGRAESARDVLVFAMAVLVLAVFGPLVGYIGRIIRVGIRLRARSGPELWGTRRDGWKLGGALYYAPDDPHLFVPRLYGVGQTVNLARPSAWVLLILLLGVPVAIAISALATVGGS